MAKLEYNGKTYSNPDEIKMLFTEYGLTYENWGIKAKCENLPDNEILSFYNSEVQGLMTSRNYITADLVALNQSTPNLDAITNKFNKEHHHVDDEVRFVVEGEGVFELEADAKTKTWMKFTSEPGDLIVIPANRRHLFYLTDKKKIRCIRLLKTKEGWEAIY